MSGDGGRAEYAGCAVSKAVSTSPSTPAPAPASRQGAPAGSPGAAPAGGGRSLAAGLVRLARPRQWVKNVLVFAAPGAAGVLTHAIPLLHALAAFALYCVVASGTYYLNDSIDAEADRAHPTKRLRPVAAGIVPVRLGMTLGVLLLLGGVAAGAAVGWRLSVVLAIYVTVQFLYSFKLKHVPVYDLACVASGFLLRAIAGGVAVGVPVSQWFLIVATFGSLLMVTGKRLAELLELGEQGGAHRATLTSYTPSFLRTVLAISSGGAIIGYALWALDLQTARLHHSDPIFYQLSIAPILLGLLYYTFLVEQGRGAHPERLVTTDRSMQLLGLVWVILFALGVYAH